VFENALLRKKDSAQLTQFQTYQRGWAISLGPIRLHCFGVRISVGLPGIYFRIFGHICSLSRLVPYLPGRYNCVIRKVSVVGTKREEVA
jgi:hypothetical protein